MYLHTDPAAKHLITAPKIHGVGMFTNKPTKVHSCSKTLYNNEDQ